MTVKSFGRCVLLLSMAGNAALYADKKLIDCSKDSLNAAIQQASVGDTIIFTGVCRENVVISVSGITLQGLGTAVIQSPSASKDVITIHGQQGVTLQHVIVQNGLYGIHAFGLADLSLMDVTVQQNTLTGILIERNSSAAISNSSTLRNGLFGIDAEDSSSLYFTGTFTTQSNAVFGLNLGAASSATLAAATLTASQNVLGIQISVTSAMFLADPQSTINAVNNFTTGLTVVSGSHLFAFGGKIVASGNGINGISLFSRSGMDLDAASQVSAFNNQQDGVHLEELSILNIFNTPAFSGAPGTTTLQVYSNVLNGISALLNSQVHMFNQTQIQDHNNAALGLQVDNGSSLTLLGSSVINNTQGDVLLTFGSRGEFSKNTIGKLSCDATVLIRGDSGKTCPAP
jgi:hypothetical protein